MFKVIIYSCLNKDPWPDELLQKSFQLMPTSIQQRISRYTDRKEQQARLLGKLLLLWHLKGYGKQAVSFLDGLGYNSFNKPYFIAGDLPCFNVSHTVGLTICGICDDMEIGVDVEGWVGDEGELEHWSKREAQLKAAGVGMVGEISEEELSMYLPRPLLLEPGYIGFVAGKAINYSIDIIPINGEQMIERLIQLTLQD